MSVGDVLLGLYVMLSVYLGIWGAYESGRLRGMEERR